MKISKITTGLIITKCISWNSSVFWAALIGKNNNVDIFMAMQTVSYIMLRARTVKMTASRERFFPRERISLSKGLGSRSDFRKTYY